MFVQSARKVQPGFNPSSKELALIVKISQIVQGMPLAIELAAAWLPILKVEEIVKELEKGLDILSTEFRDAPARHRNIRAVFEHSWSLLEPAELEIFKRLAVFSGGFTLEAAQQVTGASLPQLAGLVNKSFLSRNPRSGRLEIHQLLRQYTHERLQETPDTRIAAQEAHAAYFAAFMCQRWEHLKSSQQMRALAEIEVDIENIRAAWRYYLGQRNSKELWGFIFSLWNFHWIRWWNHAGMTLFAEATRELEGDINENAVALRALAMAFQSYFMGWLDLADHGYDLAVESVEVLRKLKYPVALAFAYDSLSVNAYFLNQYSENIEASNEMLKLATEIDDKWLLTFTYFAVGMGALLKEDFAEARQVAAKSLRLSEELGDVIGSTPPLIVLGHAALACGKYEEAEAYYLHCLKLSEKTGFPYSLQTASKYLAKVTLTLGKIVEAEQYLLQSLTITKEIGFVRDIINLFYEFARLRVAQNKPEEAIELLTFVIQHPASAQARMLEGRIRDSAQGLLGQIEGEIPAASFASAMDRGERLKLEWIIEGLIKQEI
jgi:tetratricopeptide (TPR) repeat protein